MKNDNEENTAAISEGNNLMPSLAEDDKKSEDLFDMIERRNKKTSEEDNKILINTSMSANSAFLEDVSAEEGLVQVVRKVVKNMNKFLYFSFLSVSIVIDRDVSSKDVFLVKYSDIYKSLELTIHHKALKMYLNKNVEVVQNCLIRELVHIYTIPLMDLAMDRFATKKEIIEAGEKLTEKIVWHTRKYNEFGHFKGNQDIEDKLMIN